MKHAILLFTILLFLIPFTYSDFLDSTDTDFNNGTYNGTKWNGYLELNDSAMNGTFISRAIGNSYYHIWTNITWSADITNGTISFQAASGNNKSNLSGFVGPDGTALTYYNATGQKLNLSISRYIRYSAKLNASNSTTSPRIYNVSIVYLLPPPKVSSVTPTGTINTSHSIIFRFNASSLNNISNCTFYINGSVASLNQTQVQNNTVNNITLTLTNGTYNWTVSCTDPLGNQNTSKIKYFNVSVPIISLPGIIQNKPQDRKIELNNTLTFNCTASGQYLSNVSLFGNWSNGWHKNSSNTSGTPGDYLFTTTIANGTYIWACQACNSLGNCTFSGNRTAGIGWAALELISTTPINGSTNATVNSPIKLKFNKALNNATIEGSIVMSSQPGPVSHSLSYDNKTINLTPDLPLLYNTTYYITILRSLMALEGDNITQKNITFLTRLRDSDNDGNPDNLDADDDGDGIPDTSDTVSGFASDIRTNENNIIVQINGSENLSINYNGTYKLTINNTNGTLAFLDLDLNTPNALDLRNLTIVTNEIPGKGSIVISGLNSQKTIRITDMDGKASDACVKDKNVDSANSISNECNGANETFLRCDGRTKNGFTCTQGEGYIEISGAAHTAATEECREQWECDKWLPLFCFLGLSQRRDCTDSNGCGTERFKPTVYQYCSTPRPSRGCRAEWECKEWGECTNFTRSRICTNVGQCPDHVKTPIMEEKCTPETKEQTARPSKKTETQEPQPEIQTPITKKPEEIIPEEESPVPIKSRGFPAYWTIILINAAIILGFVIYRFHPLIYPKNPNPKNPIIRDQKENHLLKKIKIAREISWLQKQKEAKRKEYDEIRKSAQEAKEMGLDSTTHRFMTSSLLDRPKIDPPKKPKITKVDFTESLLFKLFKIDIKPEKTTESEQVKIDPPEKNDNIKPFNAQNQLARIKSNLRKNTFQNLIKQKEKFTSRTGKSINPSEKLKNATKGIGTLERSDLIGEYIEKSGQTSGKKWSEFLKQIKSQGYKIEEAKIKQLMEMEKERKEIMNKLIP